MFEMCNKISFILDKMFQFGNAASFKLYNPLLGVEADDESPVDIFLNDVLDKSYARASDAVKSHLFASFNNSLMKHKGSGDDLVNFLSTPSTTKAWQIANISGVSLSDILEEDDFYQNFASENPDIKLSDNLFAAPVTQKATEYLNELKDFLSQEYRYLSKADKRKYREANDIGFRFRTAFDASSDTLYVAFPPLGSDPLGEMIMGDMGKKNFFLQADYPFRKNGGIITEPMYEMYAAYRPKIKEMLEASGAKNIYFAGHSMGGGIAHVASNDELWDSFHVQTTTFGAPAVGDSTFVRNFRADVDINRVLHSSDPVSTMGTMSHPTQKVWDIAPKGDNVIGSQLFLIGDKWSSLLKRIDTTFGLKRFERPDVETLDDVIDLTHRADGFDEAFDSILNGDLRFEGRKANGFVSYPRFRAFGDFVKTHTIGNIASAGIISKALIQESSFTILEHLDAFKNSPKLLEALTISKEVLTKVGLGFDNGVAAIRQNQFTQSFNFDASFLKRAASRTKYFEELNNLPDDLYRTATVFDDHGNILDDFIDPLVDFDDVLFKEEEVRFTEKIDFMQVRRDLTNFGLDYGKPLQPQLKPKKFVPLAAHRLGKGISSVSTDIKDVLGKHISISDDFKQRLSTQVDIARGKLDDLFNVKHYADLDVPTNFKGTSGFTDFKPTLLNTKLKHKVGHLSDVFKIETQRLFRNVYSSTGIADIGGIKHLSNIGDTMKKSSREFFESLLKGSKLGGKKGLEYSKKLKKLIAKEMPLFGTVLELGFTIEETVSDLERIEDEKAYIVWNGEIIFKTYNPDEYQELVMMNLVYESLSLDVTFDDFVNTWHGRLSSDSNGVLLIDGIRTDDPDFDVIYEKSIIEFKDQGDYSGESKTLSVLKNVGLGVFNVALDLSTVITPGASAGIGIAVGVIDEVYEQQGINYKENGYKRALKHKVFNDEIRDYVEQIMLWEGAYHESEEDARVTEILSKLPFSGILTFDMKRSLLLEYYALVLKVDSLEKEYDKDSSFDLEKGQEEINSMYDRLVKSGMEASTIDRGRKRFISMSKLFSADTNLFVEIGTSALSIPVAAASLMSSMLSIGVGALEGFSFISKIRKTERHFDALYSGLLKKYKDVQRGLDTKTFYDEAYFNMLKSIHDGRDDLKEKLDSLEIGEDISQGAYLERLLTINLTAEMDLKLLDVSVNRNSEYATDPDIIDIMEKFRSSQLKEAMLKHSEINKTLADLMDKHSGVGDTRDLKKEMRLTVAKSHIEYILSISGNAGNQELFDILFGEYMANSPGGEDAVFIDEEGYDYLSSFGITKGDVSMLVEDRDTGISLQLENAIQEQYLLITKVIDVFHDPRSEFNDDPQVIEYYESQGINIDPVARTEKRIADIYQQFEEQGIAYEEALTNISDFYVEQMKERETSIIKQYEQRFEDILTGIEDLGEDDISRVRTREEDDKDTRVEFDMKIQDGKIKLKKQRSQVSENPLLKGDSNKVLGEYDQFDYGFADTDGAPTKFTPTGKILPFTINNGMPKMLFEDGSEETYTGPKNSLVGNISTGYWIGPVPKGDHAPINTIDNLYMAYHIENQKDPLIARLRMLDRITQALSVGSISVDTDLVEYNITIATFEFLQSHNGIFGVDMESVLMNDGLGAALNTGLHESVGSARKGVLPDNISFKGKDIVVEQDVLNPLKRASEIAFDIGDESMGYKFRKISVERDDMLRVANEYLDSVRVASDSASGGGKNINPIQRLVLDQFVHQDTLQAKYTKVLLESLGKQLFEFL